MAKDSSVYGEVEIEVEIKAPADKFYHLYAEKSDELASVIPTRVQGCHLHNGGCGTVGSILFWNYVHEGQEKVAKEVLEVAEPEKKLIKYRVIEGDVMNEYKSFFITIQVTQNEGGSGSLVRWHIDYEKLNENVADPKNNLPFFAEMTREIDEYLSAEE